jgi:hypothetical protein
VGEERRGRDEGPGGDRERDDDEDIGAGMR